MKTLSTKYALPATALALTLVLGTGCKQKADETLSDATLTTNLQSKLASDPGLANEPIQVSVSNRTALLNGSVDSEAAKSLASNDAMQVAGIRGVMNNLAVQQAASGSVQAVPAPASSRQSNASQPRGSRDRDRAGTGSGENGTRGSEPSSIGSPSGSDQADPQKPAPAPMAQQPPAPVVKTVTIPAGTIIPVRLTETLDSGTTQPGTAFHGSLASDLAVGGVVAVPQGATIIGKVDDVKDATHFTGHSSITAEVNFIRAHGQSISVTTDPFVQEGKGRGKNTLEKTGAGAAIGAILGGIFGGGKGAAIGAAAGGGAGAGSNAITRGQQVVIPSETILHFRLASPVSVTTTSGAVTNYNSNGDATLQTRPK